jgi:hypothetical protein
MSALKRLEQCDHTMASMDNCLTGKSVSNSVNWLSSPLRKNISVFPKPKSSYMSSHPVPHRGALAIVTNAGRDAVDAAAPARTS